MMLKIGEFVIVIPKENKVLAGRLSDSDRFIPNFIEMQNTSMARIMRGTNKQ